MNNPEEKYRSSMLLFGLADGFSPEELRASYAALARLNHPDVSDSAESQMRMIIINDAYSFLKTYSPPPQKKSAASPEYESYKKGFIIMKDAFDQYYGESEKKTFAGNRTYLREKLLDAKNEFAHLVNDMEYNEWTSDAIDRICSINKWLD